MRVLCAICCLVLSCAPAQASMLWLRYRDFSISIDSSSCVPRQTDDIVVIDCNFGGSQTILMLHRVHGLESVFEKGNRHPEPTDNVQHLFEGAVWSTQWSDFGRRSDFVAARSSYVYYQGVGFLYATPEAALTGRRSLAQKMIQYRLLPTTGDPIAIVAVGDYQTFTTYNATGFKGELWALPDTILAMIESFKAAQPPEY